MQYEAYVTLGLNGEAPLKVIMCGSVQEIQGEKVGVVSIVYATMDRELAKKRLYDLNAKNNDSRHYYMVYSVPLDTDLTTLAHYPSIAISPEDLA